MSTTKDKQIETLQRALTLARIALDWYADISNYDEDGRPDERALGAKAAMALQKIKWILGKTQPTK